MSLAAPAFHPFWSAVCQAAEACPEKIALRIIDAVGQEETPVTFAELRDKSLRATAFLHGLGVRQGSIVVTAIPNTDVSVALSVAIGRLGAVWAPIDHDLTLDQTLSLLKVYDPAVAFLTREKVTAASARGGLNTKIAEAPSWQDMPDLLDSLLSETPVEDDATAVMLLTSGTTGLPKSVETSNRRLRSFASLAADDLDPDDALIYFGNPAWVSYMGLFVQAMSSQHTLILGQGYTKELYFPAVLKHRPSLLFCWPEVIVDFIQLPEEEQRRIASFVKFLRYGGARTPPTAVRKLVRALPNTEITQGYGSTEAGVLSWLSAEDHKAVLHSDDELAFQRLGSAGKLVDNLRFRIVDENGELAPQGVTGGLEVLPKNGACFQSYYRNPTATAKKFTADGWLILGDLGRLGEDGYLYVEGRDSETIVLLSGDNVYPSDIESVIAELPGVVEVAVAKVVAGDAAISEVGAFVRVQEGAKLTEGDVMNQCRERLGQEWARPTRVFMRTEKLPRNKNGKCLTPVLTAEASAILAKSARARGGA